MMSATRTAWFRLLRISATPTAVSNILVGYWAVTGTPVATVQLVALISASVCLYSFGMVTNDLFDLSSDRAERRPRPLVLGEINTGPARGVAVALVIVALAAAAMVSALSTAIALALVTSIVVYNAWAKRTLAGPLAMGICRGLNVLLGASHLAVMGQLETGYPESGTTEQSMELLRRLDSGWTAGWDWDVIVSVWSPSIISISLAYAIAVAGLTWLARYERSGTSRLQVFSGGLVTLVGIAGWARVAHDTVAGPAMRLRFYVLFGLLAMPIAFRWIRAMAIPVPERIRSLVIATLGSLIFFDAALAVLVTGQTSVVVPFGGLLLVQWWLRRVASPTD